MYNFYALILAGGGGKRLWPMSRENSPKQMLPLVGNRTMFKMSVERLHPLFAQERIYVSTGRNYEEDLKADASELSGKNFIVEPSARDNAAAVGLAMAVIHQRDPNAVVAMLTADHYIADVEKFRSVLQTGYQLAQEGKIVTLGITPTHPATGFGYIQQGETIATIDNFEVHKAIRFTEKPDDVTATQFVASGKYSWNSGMFIWKAETAMRELERQQPEMFALLQKLKPSVDTPEFEATLESIWEEMPRISIDYAVMENAQNMVVIPVEMGWNDVGTWSSLYDVLDHDAEKNAGNQEPERRITLDATGSMFYSDKLIVAIGVDDLVVVETEDTILICDRKRSQDVKKIVTYLKENGLKDYL
ncbi:MAG: mannose-1-phosphate guanylyltransferase [Anaerolineae bacterium]|nr:mannose-1-phosphate guanylyltransferase [Anaerolineae bacterium]